MTQFPNVTRQWGGLERAAAPAWCPGRRRCSIQPLAEDVAVRIFGDRVEIIVINDMPGIAGGGGGHAVGLASARERVRAFSDGRGDVETRLLDGRHIATMTLPL